MQKLQILTIILILFSCSNPESNPENKLEFSEIDIRFKKYSAINNTISLHIQNSGQASAVEINYLYPDTIRSYSRILDDSEKEELSNLFFTFEDFDNYYKPDRIYRNRFYYRTVLKYKNVIDTVLVYDLQNANVPSNLKKIFEKLEEISLSLLD